MNDGKRILIWDNGVLVEDSIYSAVMMRKIREDVLAKEREREALELKDDLRSELNLPNDEEVPTPKKRRM